MLQVCRVWLDPSEYFYVNTIFSHSLCGHFVNKISDRWVECSFCRTISDAAVVRTFHLKITLADKDTGTKVLAWCTGQTAMDLLQISPEEFYELPEVTFKTRYHLFIASKIVFISGWGWYLSR